MSGVFRYWPNRITALRFAGAFVLFALFISFGDRPADEIRRPIVWSFWLFVVVAATDFLDGWLARRDQHVTAFGRIADPFVDKILVVGTLVFLAVLPWSRPHLPAWMVVVVLAREFLVTAIRGYVESVGGEFPADWFGKIKMVLQCCAIGGILWTYGFAWPDAWRTFWAGTTDVLIWATLISSVGSGASYVWKTKRVLAEAGS